MAIYTFTKIEEDLLGTDTTVTVTEEVSDLNSFIVSAGVEKKILRSLNIWSADIDQVRQPVTLIKTDSNGNEKSYSKVPQLDSYQFNNQLDEVELSNFEFDADSSISYSILPGKSIKMTLNMNPKVRKQLSMADILRANLGKEGVNNFDQVLENIGLKEIEEAKMEKKPFPSSVSEPGEAKVGIKMFRVAEPEESKKKEKATTKSKAVEKIKKKIPVNLNLLLISTGVCLFLIHKAKKKNLI